MPPPAARGLGNMPGPSPQRGVDGGSLVAPLPPRVHDTAASRGRTEQQPETGPEWPNFQGPWREKMTRKTGHWRVSARWMGGWLDGWDVKNCSLFGLHDFCCGCCAAAGRRRSHAAFALGDWGATRGRGNRPSQMGDGRLDASKMVAGCQPTHHACSTNPPGHASAGQASSGQ